MDNNNPVNNELNKGEIKQKPKWFHSWWGVLLIGFLSLIVIIVVIFISLIGTYLWQIKSGKGNDLSKEFLSNKVQINKEVTIKRQEIERTDSPFLGNSKAEVVIVEFLDFKCPWSRQAAPIMQKVIQKYGDKVKLTVRHFPVESTHPGASQLSEIANCADEQKHFWAMHDVLFRDQELISKNLTQENINYLAEQTNLDVTKFQECINNIKTRVKVNRDYADGFKFGVGATPTFFINGQKVQGVIPWEQWDKLLSNI